MKQCTGCNTYYAASEPKCPACQSANAVIRCDGCGTVHSSAFCPACGLGIYETLRVCPRCGFKSKEKVCPRCGSIANVVGTIMETAASAIGTAASAFTQVSCTVAGHKWEGCKCARCGQTRDEGHDFKPSEDKCEQKCVVCGMVKPLPHQWEENKCTRCGAVKGPFARFFGFIKLHPIASLIAAGIIIAGIISFVLIASAVQRELGSTAATEDIPVVHAGIVIEYDKNLLFNKYDIRVSAFDIVLGTLAPGEKRVFDFVAPAETHTITFAEVGNDENITSIDFDVSEGKYYYFFIKAKGSGITVKSTDILTYEEVESLLR